MTIDSLIQAGKFPGTGTTVFTVMSKMAQDHGAINLSQGFPDFDGPGPLRERVAWHVANGHNGSDLLCGHRVEDEINDRTRLIMLNSPHNPSGSIWCEESDLGGARLCFQLPATQFVNAESAERT